MSVEPSIDIAFDCRPLRSIARLDAPLDASDELRRRGELLQRAVAAFGVECSYLLHNARCVFCFANSEVEGICRFQFEAVVRTDAGDRKCEEALVDAQLASETCGGVPDAVRAWLEDRVRAAVIVEFDRFIAAGRLEKRGAEAPHVDLGGDAGMDV